MGCCRLLSGCAAEGYKAEEAKKKVKEREEKGREKGKTDGKTVGINTPLLLFFSFSFSLLLFLLVSLWLLALPVWLCSSTGTGTGMFCPPLPQTLDIHYLFLIGARSFTAVGSGTAAAFSFSFHSPVPTLPIQFFCIDQTKALLRNCPLQG